MPKETKAKIVEKNRAEWFKNKIAWDKLQCQRLKALGLANSLNQEIRKNPAQFTGAILDTLARRAFDISNDPEAPAYMTKIWLNLYLQAVSFEKNLDIRERRMALREREVALREKHYDKLKKTVQNSRLSAETQAERLREIFRLNGLNEPDKAQTSTNGETEVTA